MADSAAHKILIIGGGYAGMTAALELDRLGLDVELMEIDPHWRTYGAGISLHGATMRVLERVGLFERFLEVGAVTEGVDMRSPLDDSVLVTLPTPSVGKNLPGGGGVMRPGLASILREAVRATDTKVRLGQTFTSIEQGPQGVVVTFENGEVGHYDLVVGADGLKSAVRRAVFPEAPNPRFIRQAVWRGIAPRPQGIERPTMWICGTLKAGVNLVSRDEVYVFLTENRPTNDHVPPESFVSAFSALLAQFPSPILSEVRASLSEDSKIVYRPLEQFLMPRPWYKGSVVLIGDAVHATSPHLAAGACIGVEDAVVLAEALASAETLPEALADFETRRWERCRMVVENSGRLAEIEIEGGDQQEHAQIMRQSLTALAEAI